MKKKLIIILGVIGTAFSAIFVRFSTAPTTVMVFYRMLFAVLFLCPVIRVCNWQEIKQLKTKDWLLCALSGLFLGLHFTCYFESLRWTSIASSVVLVDTEVFFVAIVGSLFLGEKLTATAKIGMIITFAGSVIVAMNDAGAGHLTGDFIALGGAICSCIYTITGRICRTHISTNVYTCVVYFFAGLVTFIFSILQQNAVFRCGSRNILVALGMTVFCTILGHSIFSWGLKYEKASFVSVVKLLEPVFASILGILIFHEIPTILTIVGGSVIIAGICMEVGALRWEN